MQTSHDFIRDSECEAGRCDHESIDHSAEERLSESPSTPAAARGTKPLPFFFCVDLEPDERTPVRATDQWDGVEATVDRFSSLRDDLQRLTRRPVRFGWFLRMDPQIAAVWGDPSWAARRYSRQLNSLRMKGDEIGLHVHPFRQEGTDWILDLRDERWVEHCVRSSLAAFRSAFDTDCRSFRFGDRWLTERALDVLESEGVRNELTPEPGASGPAIFAPERYRGSFPDLRAIPSHPYYPSRRNFRREGTRRRRNIRIIPITTGLIEVPWENGQTPPRESGRGGTIELSPRRVALNSRGLAAVTLSWKSWGTTLVDIRVDAPDGPLFNGSEGQGEATTGPWARDGMRFFLQDVEDARPLTFEHTLATVAVRGASRDRTLLLPRRRFFSSRRWKIVALNPSTRPSDFSSVLHTALNSNPSHVSMVVRSDACSHPLLRERLETNLATLISQLDGIDVAFITPNGTSV